MPRKSPAAVDLEPTKEFFMWCRSKLIAKATITLPSGAVVSVEFSPLALIQEANPATSATPAAHNAAVKELLDAARENQARQESAAVAHTAPASIDDDPDLYWSASK